MQIRRLMAPEGVSDGGGGGGGSNGANAPAAPAAAPSRGRIGDFSSLRGEGDAPAPAAPRVAPPRDNMRAPIPGDEGVEPPDATDEPIVDGEQPAGSEADLEVDPNAEPAADELGAEAPLFGMAPAELVASLREGKVPTEMMTAIMGMQFNVPIDGQNYAMTIPEMQKAAMRGVVFSQKTRALADERRQAQSVIERDEQRTKAWQDPTGSALHDDLMKMGCGYDVVTKTGPLIEIAKFIAAQCREFDAMTPAEQRAYVREQEAIARADKLEAEAKQLEERQSSQRHNELKQHHAGQIERSIPIAFQRAQIKDSKLARELFGTHLRSVVAANPKIAGVTPELLDTVAGLVKESLIDLGRLETPTPTPAARPTNGQPAPRRLQPVGAPPPTALPGAVRPGANPGRPKQGRIGDLSPLYKRS